MQNRTTGILALMGLCLLLARCAAPSVEARQAEAEGAYGAALLLCVEDAGTLAESKACRAKVDQAWGVKQTVTIPPAMLVQPKTLLDGGAREGGAS